MNRSANEATPQERQPQTGQTSAEAVAGEDRSFAPRDDAGARDELLGLLEAELRRPLMAAEPHQFSEEHRRRLLHSQQTVCDVMERLRACGSAEEVATTLLRRLEGGELDELEADARFLGFRSPTEVAQALAERAGFAQSADAGGAAQRRTDRRAASRQDALLDEALEETFPASDPVAVFRP